MQKILTFFKTKWLHMVPFLIVLISIIISYNSNISSSQKYCTNGCFAAILDSFLFLMLFFLPGALSLLFVRRKVFGAWSLFALPYIYISVMFLSKQEVDAMLGPGPRAVYSIELGLALSIITILWAIIHSLIIRLNEKKKDGGK